MALFKVNTGCREQEVCRLRWDWEIRVPELGTSVFLIPGDHVKNGDPRLVVLNRVARSVIEGERGVHPEFVFTYRGAPVTKMNNSAWKRARCVVGLPQVRVHDLKHTFGRRLRPPVCRSRIARICWGISRDGSQITILPRNLRI